MSNLSGTLTYTAQDTTDFNNTLASLTSQAGYVITSSDSNNLTISFTVNVTVLPSS